MNGALEIRNILKANAGVIAIIGTSDKVSIGIASPPEWSLSDTTALIYQSGIRDATLEYYETEFTVDCRATTEPKSIALQDAVIEAINRKSTSTGIFKCSAYAVIPPVDESDNYNTPAAIRVTGK